MKKIKKNLDFEYDYFPSILDTSTIVVTNFVKDEIPKKIKKLINFTIRSVCYLYKLFISYQLILNNI
jgi:hypothetical protein